MCEDEGEDVKENCAEVIWGRALGASVQQHGTGSLASYVSRCGLRNLTNQSPRYRSGFLTNQTSVSHAENLVKSPSFYGNGNSKSGTSYSSR
jgi:hypothetical protein